MQLHLLPIGLLLALVVSVDAQAAPQPSAVVLNSEHGLTPCQMQDNARDACQNSRARDDDDMNPPRLTTPTACTCTNVYFNLWSACLYTSSGLANVTLPACDSVVQQCAQASINITIQPPPSQSEGTYPLWAYSQLPAFNDTFDLSAAIETASGASHPHKWDVVQIVLPIIVGVCVAAASVVGFCVYRKQKVSNRRQLGRPWMLTGNRSRFNFPTISSAHKVRTLDRSGSWSIDERQEELDEYEFVSYPASLQGSQASGHVRLSSTSSQNPAGPPMLKIPKNQAVSAWPGKAIWNSSLQSARQLRGSIPGPWRSTKRVPVQNVPGYKKFRVDASDSDSPLSQRPHDSLLGHTERGQTNLRNETVFEGEDEEESDSDAEVLPLIPEQHSHSNHDAEPLSALAIVRSPDPDPNGSQRPVRRTPPSSSPPSAPLPPPPQQRQRQEISTQRSVLTSPPSPKTPRSRPAFPPAPTSPPPPPPFVQRRSPRAARPALPAAQSSVLPPVPLPALPSPPVSAGRQLPPPPEILPPPRPRQRPSSGSSVRSLPSTPTPPYDRAPRPTPSQPGAPESPLNSPPYIQRPSQDYSHSPPIPPLSPENEIARSVRRLPLPPN
ncbi:hypothetical protein B0H11DRAFT_1021217 [Mycena galericulata]|nr:hypothetical protein B0H11DRAFT_1021217 [Mycena galericulata]